MLCPVNMGSFGAARRRRLRLSNSATMNLSSWLGEIRAGFWGRSSMQPETQYAGDVHIAYQVFGEGPLNLVALRGWIRLSAPASFIQRAPRVENTNHHKD